MRWLESIYGLSDTPVGKETLKHLYVGTGVFVALVSLFAYIAATVTSGGTLPVDTRILLGINEHANVTLDAVALGVTYSGNMATLIGVTALLVIISLRVRKRRTAMQVVFTMGGAIMLNAVLKLIFRRDRPELWHLLTTEATYSFPSGHSLLSAAFAALVVIMLWKTSYRWVALAAGIAYPVCVGLSRLYLGVHYPTDVLAGWCVGVAWAIVVAIILGAVKLHGSDSRQHAK